MPKLLLVRLVALFVTSFTLALHKFIKLKMMQLGVFNINCSIKSVCTVELHNYGVTKYTYLSHGIIMTLHLLRYFNSIKTELH